MSEKPLKAYHVGEDSDGHQVIVFATSSAAGRRIGGNELNLMFEEVTFCRRAPWADEFAGQPFIPAKAYHEQGWWLSCNNCETQLYDDAEDDDGNRLQIVYEGRHAYCNQDCKDARDREVADLNAKGEAFKAKVLAARSDLTFTKWSVGWPRITQSVLFTFPGGRYHGELRDQDGTGALEIYVANGDKDAWAVYEAGRQAA
ncbi:hypothetical protein SA496_15715 [Pseudomonas sp. JS3066]|uniref:hypothetical protein n=1 Tax=Pseudomonas sp. JS3066 TaxID=3090665 RepID=UPI002E7B9DDD|nr:hypothetical protein [Pseudomonas sp. JS3066]WVK91176.1 hypothetical protein SA496_15715 [Pseudomonas sp. JS3066]